MNDTDEIAGRFSVLDHVPMGICVIRRDYLVLYWNSCMADWTGMHESALKGTTIMKRFAHFNEPRYRSRLDAIFDGGPPAIFSSQLHKELFPSRLPNGEPRILHTIVTPVPAIETNEFYAMFAVADITELTHRILDYREMRDKALEEIEQRKRTEAEKEKLIGELRDALDRINTLSAMLPICASCKKIRDDNGYWRQVEEYMSKHAPVNFTHCLCPDCAKKYDPTYFNRDAG
jgi:PAS domain S-box-containing protein